MNGRNGIILIKFVFFSLLVTSLYSCGSSYYDEDEYRENMKKMRKRQAKEFEKELQINFENGKRIYFLQQFVESSKYFEKCEQWKYYKDSIRTFYSKNLDFAIQNGQYIWAKDIARIYGIQNNELNRLLDSIQLAKKIEEEEKIREKEIEKGLKEAVYNEAVGKIESYVNDLYYYYNDKLSGKSRNSMADFLYYEGFSRDIRVGSTLIEEFIKFYYFDKNGNILEMVHSGEFYCILNIDVWYSYGYGNLYYSVDYSIVDNNSLKTVKSTRY